MPHFDWVTPVLATAGAVVANIATEHFKAWNERRKKAADDRDQEEKEQKAALLAAVTENDRIRKEYFDLRERLIHQEEEDLRIRKKETP